MITSAIAGCLGACLAVAMGFSLISATQLTDPFGYPVYVAVRWVYPPHARFDNTAWTYGTDYAITAVTFYLASLMWMEWRRWDTLRACSIGIMLLDGTSTLIGGAAHHVYSGIATDLNSTTFRVTWTVVVGLTAVTGSVIGYLASSILWRCDFSHPFTRLCSGPFWASWGVTLALANTGGMFSHARPACDIFIAGAAQAFPTFYLCFAVFYCFIFHRGKYKVSPHTPIILITALLNNAPLLFLFPHLVRTFSLGVTNAILHSFLFVSWAGQGWALRLLLPAIPPANTGKLSSTKQLNKKKIKNKKKL